MPSLSGHSWIRELEKAVLLVEADHPGWIQLLQTKQSELLKVLRRRFPAENIAGISFRLCKEGPRSAGPAAVGPAAVGPAGPAAAGQEAGAPAAESPAGPDSGERGLDSITDARLKYALTGLEKALGESPLP
jgi:hypothetical protein